MNIDIVRSLSIIAVCVLVTFAERYFPFAFFRNREVPDVIRYLGKMLPMAVIAALTVYCLRSTGFSAPVEFVPPLAAAAVTVFLHLWRSSTLLSVAGGTAAYMILLRLF